MANASWNHRDKRLVRLSKALTQILRYTGPRLGLQFDEDGWCTVKDLIRHVCGNTRRKEEEYTAADINKTLTLSQSRRGERRFEYDNTKSYVRATKKRDLHLEKNYSSHDAPAWSQLGSSSDEDKAAGYKCHDFKKSMSTSGDWSANKRNQSDGSTGATEDPCIIA